MKCAEGLTGLVLAKKKTEKEPKLIGHASVDGGQLKIHDVYIGDPGTYEVEVYLYQFNENCWDLVDKLSQNISVE